MAVHAQGMGLKDDDIVVAVNDETGEVVAFGVDEAEDIGERVVDKAELLTVVESLLETLEEEIVGNDRRVERENLADDRLLLEMADSEPLAVGVADIDEVALGGVSFGAEDGAGEEPGVAAGEGRLFAFAEDERRTGGHRREREEGGVTWRRGFCR